MLTRDQVAHVVATATSAPSVHNTQPWSFRDDGAALELRTDVSRALTHQDPRGRELLLSCGAAALTAELAVRGLGLSCAVELLPDDQDPELVARLLPGPPSAVTGPPSAVTGSTDQDAHLLRAVPHRHTHRGALCDVPLPAALLHALSEQAALEGATVQVLGPTQTADLALLSAHAQSGVLDHRAAVAERQAWGRHEELPQDGLPARVVPGWEGATARRHAVRSGTLPRGTVVVLLTAEDDRPDWVRAGRALARVLLQATSLGVAATPWTLPLEVADVRRRLGGALGLTGAPQMVLRLGRPVGSIEQTTRRRPVRDVLSTADGAS